MKRVLAALILIGGGLALAYGVFETRRERTYRLLVNRGETALAGRDLFAAIEDFSGAVTLRSDSMLGYLRRGEAYLRRGEYEAALRDLTRACELDATATRPRELRGDVERALLRYDRAAESYRAYLRLDDQSPRLLYKLGLSEFQARHFHEAVEALTSAVHLDPRAAEAEYLLGLSYSELERTSESIAAFQRAVALAPALVPAREELAAAFGRTGQRERRIQQLEAILALEPRPARAVTLAVAQEEHGLLDQAVQTLRRASDRFPASPEVHAALGRLWLDEAEADTGTDDILREKARIALERAADEGPDSETLGLLGRAQFLAGDVCQAERTLEQAASRRPVDESVFVTLADAAERCGHPGIARRALLDHRTLAGEPPDARLRLATDLHLGDLSWQIADLGAVVRWYRRGAQNGPLDPTRAARLADAERRAAISMAIAVTAGRLFH